VFGSVDTKACVRPLAHDGDKDGVELPERAGVQVQVKVQVQVTIQITFNCHMSKATTIHRYSIQEGLRKRRRFRQ
jgi:hypothetical protein